MKQLNLFEEELDLYEKEWQDMPQFIMTPEVPLLTIKISFKTQEDIQQFEKLISQKIYYNRENYWYPKLNRSAFSNQIYSDES
jgi:hypothetical protein